MKAERNHVVCFGATVMDRKYHAASRLEYGSSNPVSSSRSHGGVARNVAENLARLQVPACMVSVVGADAGGRELIQALAALAVDVSGISVHPVHHTAEYAAVLQPDQNLAFGIADMNIFDTLDSEKLQRDWPLLAAAAWVFADCNLPAATLHELIGRCRDAGVRLALDAVSVHKVARLPAGPCGLAGVDTLFLNQDEAQAYLGSDRINNNDDNDDSAGGTSGKRPAPEQLLRQLAQRGARHVVMTMGADGVLLGGDGGVQHLPAVRARVVDVTGAGDALVSGTLYGLIKGAALAEAVSMGSHLATLTLETDDSVRQDLSPAILQAAMEDRIGARQGHSQQ